MDKELRMTDDELEQFCDVRFERLGSGRFAVFGQIEVGGKVEMRRIQCSNPAWGTAQLEEELSELLLAHERAKAKRRKAKAKRRLKRPLRHIPVFI
jgi:hypothetical protein